MSEEVLHTRWLGKEIKFYDEISSTNTEAKKLADAGAPNGTVVVAETQTAGRGRRGRQWISPKGQGIWCSLILKPEICPDKASMITLVAALAVARTIEQETGITPGIKWPNDIILSGRKVCGILTEMNAEKNQIKHIVVGVGINVKAQKFPAELEPMATSLENELGSSVSRKKILYGFLEKFEHFYELYLQTGDLSQILEMYQQYLVNKDVTVKVVDVKGDYEGIARGINMQGELLVERDGVITAINSGEISVRGIYGYV